MAYEATMERQHKPRSGMALGGLGSGWFELRQDGTFHNWNLFNNRPLGRGRHFLWDPQSVLFFLVRFQVAGATPCVRLLQIEESHGAAAIERHEYHYIFPWLQGMDRITYSASFPFARLTFREQGLPLELELEAWAPFIPGDVKNSSLPVAFFDFTIRSLADAPVEVTILATMRNCVGYDTQHKHWRNRIVNDTGYRFAEMSCEHLDSEHASFGSMGLASLHEDSTFYLGWEHLHPYYEQLLRERSLPDFDDTAGRNSTDPATARPTCMERCFSTIGRTVTLARRGDILAHSFATAWHFPNRYARTAGDDDGAPVGYLENEPALAAALAPPHLEGHWYSNFFDSAAAVADYAVINVAMLKAETRKFHDSFFAATLPSYVLDQVNSQLNTFRTSSWLTKNGDFGILEGLSPTRSYAGLSTIDVAMYGSIATTALFPELDRSVIRTHLRFQEPSGVICHSITQNFRDKDAREAKGTRIDLPAQYAYLALRAAFWADDRAFLKEVWPSVTRALEYVLRERDPNGDGLPDMAGIMCSYDNFPMYGIAPYVATQWLAALAAAVEAATLLGDLPARDRYAALLTQGAAAVEKQTWNGSYYRLYSDRGGARGDVDEGCLTDQIIGQWACRLAALPAFLKPERVTSALRQILARNYHPDQGVRNCQWPEDTFLHEVARDCWVDQANTCWTGVELALASFLIYEGLVDEGLMVVRNVDDRYRRWGMYFDHQEFGGHYFRPMSAWALVHAALGFSLHNGCATFDPRIAERPCSLFFITPTGFGHFEAAAATATVRIDSGCLSVRQLRIHCPQPATEQYCVRAPGYAATVVCREGFAEVSFPDGFTVPAGSRVELSPA